MSAEFASQDRVSANPALKNDFIERVLDLPWAFISDESSLWDFTGEQDMSALSTKINEIYSVDVSDITSGNLADIFERISVKRH